MSNASEEGPYEESYVVDTDSVVYKCSLCNARFDDINEHFASFHSDVKNDQESIEYEDVFSDDDGHLESLVETEGFAFVVKNEDGKFECGTCFKTFKSIKLFLSHVKTHGEIAKESIKKLDEIIKELKNQNEDTFDVITVANCLKFRCKSCRTIFPTRKQMRLHYAIHLNVTMAKDQASKILEESFTCGSCNKSLKTANELDMHISAHAETSHGSLQTMKQPKTKKKEVTEKGRPYACQYCKKEFHRPYEKVKHERVHTGEKPYSCEICGKKFRVVYCLTLHKKNVHSEERPFCCSFENCNKRFKSQSVYNHHINTHKDEKNFKCPSCPKAFKTSVQLGGHKKTHSKPFTCKVCTRSFSSLYSVKTHMEVHQREKSNLKYSCTICKAQYGRLFALTDHCAKAHPGNEFVSESAEHYIIEESQSEVADEQEEVYVVMACEEA